MPLIRPYQSSYNQGDLIYGISNIRTLYRTKNPYFNLARGNETASTIDQYSLTEIERKCIVDGKRQPVPDNEYFQDCIKAHKKYKSAYYAKGTFLPGLGIIQHENVVGRKCKGGLYWVTSTQYSLKKTIHFLLDEINFQSVVSKINPETGAAYKNSLTPFFTGVELRWVYRNRYKPEVIQSIQFWINGKPCHPPWVKEFTKDAELDYDPTSLWSTYKPASAKKGSVACTIL